MSGAHAPQPVVILISGRGGNMRALIEDSRAPGSCYEVVRVLSDQPNAAGLELAGDAGVPAQALGAARTPDRAAYDQSLAAAIGECSPALIVLAGFMRILSAPFVARFAGEY